MIGHDASEFRPVLTRCWSSAEIQGMSGEKCRIDDAPKIDIKASPLDPHRGESFGWSYFVSSRTIGSLLCPAELRDRYIIQLKKNL